MNRTINEVNVIGLSIESIENVSKKAAELVTIYQRINSD